jgi:FtsZ-interacting cell division protein ZipA
MLAVDREVRTLHLRSQLSELSGGEVNIGVGGNDGVDAIHLSHPVDDEHGMSGDSISDRSDVDEKDDTDVPTEEKVSPAKKRRVTGKAAASAAPRKSKAKPAAKAQKRKTVKKSARKRSGCLEQYICAFTFILILIGAIFFLPLCCLSSVHSPSEDSESDVSGMSDESDELPVRRGRGRPIRREVADADESDTDMKEEAAALQAVHEYETASAASAAIAASSSPAVPASAPPRPTRSGVTGPSHVPLILSPDPSSAPVSQVEEEEDEPPRRTRRRAVSPPPKVLSVNHHNTHFRCGIQRMFLSLCAYVLYVYMHVVC